MSTRRGTALRQNSRRNTGTSADNMALFMQQVNETAEENLRRELTTTQKENDRLRDQVHSLQTLLAQRPPLEQFQDLEREFRSLELLLQGTMRENERAMQDLERSKAREKQLETELARLAGENWQTNLHLGSSGGGSPLNARGRPSISDDSPSRAAPTATATQENTKEHLEKVRLLILGMDQRLRVKEKALNEAIARADEKERGLDGISLNGA